MSEVKAYDDIAVRAPIGLARTLLKVRGSTAWAIALDQTDRTREWVEKSRARFTTTNLEFIPWFDLADFYNKSVTLLSSQMVVVRTDHRPDHRSQHLERADHECARADR